MRNCQESVKFLYSCGISQEKIAEMVGVTRQYVNYLKSGRYIGSESVQEELDGICEQAVSLGFSPVRLTERTKKPHKSLQQVLSGASEHPRAPAAPGRLMQPTGQTVPASERRPSNPFSERAAVKPVTPNQPYRDYSHLIGPDEPPYHR